MKDAKAAIAKAWRDQVSGEPIDGPVSVYIDAYKPLPKSVKQEREWTLKPDADNIAKLVMDALNGIAYTDDANIVRLSISKHRQQRSTVEYVKITVRRFRSVRIRFGGSIRIRGRFASIPRGRHVVKRRFNVDCCCNCCRRIDCDRCIGR